MRTRQSTNATTDGSTGAGSAGSSSNAEAKKSTERTAADNLTLPSHALDDAARAVSKYDPETSKASAQKEIDTDLRFMSVSLLSE